VAAFFLMRPEARVRGTATVPAYKMVPHRVSKVGSEVKRGYCHDTFDYDRLIRPLKEETVQSADGLFRIGKNQLHRMEKKVG
jgi:hypothetical protein